MEATDKNQKSEDAEDRYVATIVDKLRELPYRERLMAKHEIENTLYKFQMQARSANNMGHNFPLLHFPMTFLSPQIHDNNKITLQEIIKQINPYLHHTLQHQCLHLRTCRSIYHRMKKETKLIVIKLF